MSRKYEKMGWARGLVLSALVSFACAPAARAAEKTVKDYVDEGLISWQGAESATWLNSNTELLLKFSNTAVNGSLTIGPTLGVTARVLAVGGGGAGGTASDANYGMGGGGGAGAVVDTTVTLDGATYSVHVGKGGQPGGGDPAPGGNGGESYFGVSLVEAAGGGGGGAQSVGQDGASGGGGSRSAANNAGGAATAGNPGGTGKTKGYAAGGGGAGTAGSDNTAVKSGAGGDGKSVDITGSDVIYGGGGGGGTSKSTSGAAGGNGGGGSGSGKAGGDTAVAGTDGFGGGGGGGGAASGGAAGGSGVVYVRIISATETKVALPVIDDIPYDGASHTVFTSSPGLVKVSGTVTATKVGNYSFVLRPDSTHEWADIGGRSNRTVTWKIVPAKVEIPTAKASLVYNGLTQTGVAATTGSTVTGNTGKNAGDYTAKAVLTDKTNTVWADGTTDDRSIGWTISPQTVKKPIPNAGLVYNGKVQQGYDSIPSGCSATLGETSATDAGTYEVVFELKGNTSTVINYVWEGKPVSSKPYQSVWTIATAPNQITRLSIDGWRVGSEPSKPVLVADWGANTVQFYYGMGDSLESVKTWVVDPKKLEGSGIGWVKAQIPGTANYAAAEANSPFTIWEDPVNLFRDSVEITISGHSGTETFTDIPVLVRVSESKMHGFTYQNAGPDGHSLSFVSPDGSVLAYDVDTWNVEGESLVWVRLPSLPPAGATIVMYWHLKPGELAPEYHPENVWLAGYAGVWHMGETIEALTAAVTRSADSSGHLLDLMPMRGPGMQGNLSRMVSVKGAIGNARVNDTGTAQAGNYFEVPNYDDQGLTDTFAFSCWMRVTALTGSNRPQIANRRANPESTSTPGWGISLDPNYPSRVSMRGSNNNVVNATFSESLLTAGFVHWTFVYKGTTGYIYANGKLLSSGTIAAANVNELALLLGNGYSAKTPGNVCSFAGEFDEVRLQRATPSAARIAEEFTMVNKAGYTENSLVVCDGLYVNYWLEEPRLDKTSWDLEHDTPGKIVNFGKPVVGTVTNYIYSVYDPTKKFKSISELTEAGFYRIVFGVAAPEGYAPLVKEIDVRIVTSKPYTDIAGENKGDSGRVLLMNRSGVKDCQIDYQGYADTSDKNTTFWEHLNQDGAADGSTLPYNLQLGTESILWPRDRSRRLWHLKDCRHGNPYPTSKSSPLASRQNYLPWDTVNDYSFKSRMSKASTDFTKAGQIVMRNTEDASVYSSCLTGGVGVVYFDAVNGWFRNGENPTNYTLVVEYATETTEGLEPTDENCNDGEDFYGNLRGMWRRAKMIPFKKDGTTAFVREDETEELHLGVTRTATYANFYRVVVPLDCRQAVRFRIRRTVIVPHEGPTQFGIDDGGYIILDNVIASVPAMSGKLEPYGLCEEDKLGEQYVGQELAMSEPYPSIHDRDVIARAKVSYYVNGGDGDTALKYTTNDFFSSATLHYRWRYLNQKVPDLDGWKRIDLNPALNFRAETKMEIPPYEGDIEFWYEYLLQAPFYRYVDYSGTGLGVPYTEEAGVVSNRLDVAGQPSGGSDWAFRLRNGKSRRDRVILQMSGKLAGEYPMTLISDGQWQALIKVPTNVNGSCGMTFRALNLQREGAEEKEFNEVVWGDSSDGRVEAIPINGSLIENGSELLFDLDHAAGYLQVIISEDYLTWSITRAEYQNFNHWNDIHHPEFSANFVETNGVDDVAMQVYTADMSDWNLFNPENDAWNENFYLADYFDPGYPRDVVFQTHSTPRQWNGSNLSFVWTELVENDKIIQKDEYGLAAKLQGLERGALEFIKDDCPQGLDTVKFRAHLGQSMTFDAMSYAPAAFNKQNYTFWTPAIMSTKCNQDSSTLGDMAVCASCSVIGYHRATRGCYEFRIERRVKGMYMYASIIKWYYENGVIKSKVLCGHMLSNFNNGGRAYLWQQDNATTKYLGAIFISCRTAADNKSTEIVGGFINPYALSDAVDAKPITELGNGKYPRSYQGLWCTDAANPHLCGSYGVAAKDCPVRFPRMCHFDFAFDSTKISSHATGICSEGNGRYYNADGKEFAWNETQAKYDFQDIYKPDPADPNRIKSDWEVPPGRMEPYQDADRSNRIGLRAPVGITQHLYLQLQPKKGGVWTTYGEIEIKSEVGYSFRDFEIPLYLVGNWNMRLTTGDYNVDVVLDDIVQTQWQAPDRESIMSRSDDFVYTQGITLLSPSNVVDAVKLQPARGVIDKAFSLRSPVLNGAGHVAVSYTNADENTEIWLQVATNGVMYNLIGANGYNNSIDSVDLGRPEPLGAWITLAKYKYEDLGPFGRKTAYCGWHDVTADPRYSIFRVFIPTNVVGEAQRALTTKPKNTGYGSITITGMTVSDEPEISDRAWRGWNLRSIGDVSDSESRMYLRDTTLDSEVGHGLDCALNNGIRDIRGDIARASSAYPAIYSPTLGTTKGIKSGVGALSFRARLYTTSGTPETSRGGRIVLYGASNSVSGQWIYLDEFAVTSSAFTQFNWAAGAETYAAIKLEIHDAVLSELLEPVVDRVILDEVVISEKVQPSLGFVYAWPFRDRLMDEVELENIGNTAQQPLCGESWGVQTKLVLRQMSDEIDLERGFDVYLSYYRGKDKWGYGYWKDDPKAVKHVPLTHIGNISNLVYRSVGTSPETLVQPINEGGSVVQFQVTVNFYDRGGVRYERSMESAADWRQPDWFHPVDFNRDNGGYDAIDRFSPYTILDTVSPGRAWINEVNYNDGPAEETGTRNVVDYQQFIEICVPSGISMKDWYVRLTDVSQKQWIMALFNDKTGQLPEKKISKDMVNGYEFVVIESPLTQSSGKFLDEDGKVFEPDGVWTADGIKGTAPKGTLNYSYPFQFELVRPSGVIEHQFVLQGTNEWTDFSFGSTYYGTNLLDKLEQEMGHSPIRFYAAEETSRRKTVPSEFGSAGVTGGRADGNPAPGREGTWESGLKFTPGKLNDGQTIPKDWLIAPNGTNSWVYLTVEGEHIRQDFGGDTNRSLMVVLSQGTKTNVVYEVDPWYEVSTIIVNDKTNHVHLSGRSNFAFTPDTQIYRITAIEGPQQALVDDYGLGDDNPYTPSVLKWLGDNWPDENVKNLRLAKYAGLYGDKTVSELELTTMYWLDIPPFTESGKDEWWLRGGITDCRGQNHIITRTYSGVPHVYTNIQLEVKLFISNSVTRAAHAPTKLQGLGSKSSDDFTGAWDSETFKINGKLLVNEGSGYNLGYLPFRIFYFDENSFTGKNDPKPFTSLIELLDPYSTESPGYGYGWGSYPNTTGRSFEFQINDRKVPLTPERLKAKDTYESN